MHQAKVLTICGSLKFKDKIIEQTEKLELAGNCVLSIIYPTNENKDYYTDAQAKLLDKLHKQKIDMSDGIFVVNLGGYIGSSTKSEIEYAKANNKEVLYLEEDK